MTDAYAGFEGRVGRTVAGSEPWWPPRPEPPAEELDAVAWAVEVPRPGAGEILLTSMDADGTKDGTGGRTRPELGGIELHGEEFIAW